MRRASPVSRSPHARPARKSPAVTCRCRRWRAIRRFRAARRTCVRRLLPSAGWRPRARCPRGSGPGRRMNRASLSAFIMRAEKVCLIRRLICRSAGVRRRRPRRGSFVDRRGGWRWPNPSWKTNPTTVLMLGEIPRARGAFGDAETALAEAGRFQFRRRSSSRSGRRRARPAAAWRPTVAARRRPRSRPRRGRSPASRGLAAWTISQDVSTGPPTTPSLRPRRSARVWMGDCVAGHDSAG